MSRFFLYLFVVYIIFFLLRILIRYWKRKGGLSSKSFFRRNVNKKRVDKKYDKSKAVDADFEEIK